MSIIAVDARKIKSTTGRYVKELLLHLEELDHANTYKVLVLPSDAGEYVPEHPNFEVLVADFNHYSFAEQLGFNRFLRDLSPDLVHFYMPQQPLLYTGRAVTTIHDLNLIRITENDMNPLELFVKKKIFAFLLRKVARRSAHIIAPTQFTKDDLVNWSHISPDKVTVTYEGVYHIGHYEPLPQYKNTDFLVYLGRAEPYKNNRRMIDAHQRLLKDNPKLRMVICGAIDELRQSDINWVKSRGYKNVDFLGWTDDEQAAWLYKHCKAYIAPSYLEGFGLPALEAMGQGAPIVSANTTCSPEVLGNAAHYFDPLSIDDMARAIRDVLTNDTLRKTLTTNGRAQVKKYDWRTMAEQTLDIYKNVLSQR